jgi:MFS family permease
MATTNPQSIWTPAFALLCIAQFLGYAQNSILQPTFPLYVTQLGGSPFIVGLVLGSFAVTSIILRPVIGHWADRWNEAGVMIAGLLFMAASLLLCFLPSIEATMLANGLRGIGWGGLNAAGYTLLAVSAPQARRGEASGYYSGIQGSATILFPAVALWLIYAPFGGFRLVFGLAVALAIMGAVAGLVMTRYIPGVAHRRRLDEFTPWWRELFNFVDRDIWPPSAMLFFLNLSLPAMSSFIVLYAEEIAIENFGWYFVATGTTNLLARPLLGRASDKIGHGRSMAAGFTVQIAALVLLIIFSNLFGTVISGILYMLGIAIGSSTALALALERANPQRRGKAMATFSVAYPLSYGIGSLVTGSVVEILGYTGMFVFVAGLAALGLVFALLNAAKLR